MRFSFYVKKLLIDFNHKHTYILIFLVYFP